MSELTFAIGEVASMLGLSTHTIRAWERRHVLDRPQRAASGQRRYTAEDVERLRRVKDERRGRAQAVRITAPAPPARSEAADPLRLVADLVPEVVVVIDDGGHIRHGNTAFLRFADLMPSQLQGASFADLVDPFDRAKAVSLYQAPVTARRGWELGLRTRRRRALFSFDCWPLPSSDGPVLALVGRQLDDTPAAANAEAAPEPAEPALEASIGAVPAVVRALLRAVADPVRTFELLRPWLDATPLGVALVANTSDRTIVAANGALSTMTPSALRPVEGQPWRRLAAGLPDGTIERCPVTTGGGTVTHLLMAVRDTVVETAAGRRLDVLTASGSEFRAATDRRQILNVTARLARSLLPNAGSLVAERSPERGTVGVVGGDGVWARTDRGANRELRLALIRDVMRNGVSVEVERAGTGDTAETLRIVPLRVEPAGTVQGALAFSRLDGGPFSADERLLVAEFAGRVCMALARTETLSREAVLSA